MKQIDKVAREIKRELAGTYNDYYKSLSIFYDKEDDELYVKFWGQGEHWITKPSRLVFLCSFASRYGNWGDDYGSEKDWTLTKKKIALAMKEEHYTPDWPDWLKEEIEYYAK